MCDGVILNVTPAACVSEPVRYEVRQALNLGKPIFPIILERIASYDDAIRDLGLPKNQHIEDFTDVTKWDEQVQRLLRDLEKQGLRVTPHDLRQHRDRSNASYRLHQTYLRESGRAGGNAESGADQPGARAGREPGECVHQLADRADDQHRSAELENHRLVANRLVRADRE